MVNVSEQVDKLIDEGKSVFEIAEVLEDQFSISDINIAITNGMSSGKYKLVDRGTTHYLEK